MVSNNVFKYSKRVFWATVKRSVGNYSYHRSMRSHHPLRTACSYRSHSRVKVAGGNRATKFLKLRMLRRVLNLGSRGMRKEKRWRADRKQRTETARHGLTHPFGTLLNVLLRSVFKWTQAYSHDFCFLFLKNISINIILWPGLVIEVLLRWINYAVVLHPTSEAPTTPLVRQSCKIQAAADTDTVTHLWRVVNDDGEGLWDRIFWRDPTHSALHKKKKKRCELLLDYDIDLEW